MVHRVQTPISHFAEPPAFDFAALAQENVRALLRGPRGADDAVALAARAILGVALRGARPWEPVGRRLVAKTAQGIMAAVLQTDHSLAQGGVAILKAIQACAAESGVDTEAAMAAALAGIAELQDRMTPARLRVMREFLAVAMPEAARALDSLLGPADCLHGESNPGFSLERAAS